ncbi:S41 family peptidase [uncultured Winogradskyella sp.]|uniref:S41 family peptidase n=1 Tax=uncultured Winogradskyella sp. TaxID=395353 RepID=UPI00261AF04A|nr:S41 family peptidase [uncultured Winogradskyella sp.]
MKKVIILIIVIILNSACNKFNGNSELNFEFPKSKMGEFAKDWFSYINSRNDNYLLTYDKNKEWEDHLSMIKDISSRVDGITPYLISYETEDFISIYSKEKKGSWIKVNLGLNSVNEITAAGLKKTYKPIDYDLRKKLTIKEVKEIIADVSENLRTNYVIEKSRSILANEIDQFMANGRYNSINQGDLLADVLTKDLINISNDKHLQIIPPSRILEVESRFGITKDELDFNLPLGDETLKLSNISAKVLENNIGYIKLERFVSNLKTINDTKDAFSTLLDTKAVIIDIRYSSGGDGLAVADLLSYFFKKNELIATLAELGEISYPENNTKIDNLKSKFLKKPLYVLTSSKTISAGEAFVYLLKAKKRALIIGEKTAGAGFRVDAFKLSNGFYFVNSIYTSFDIENGEGWQGSGVLPDINLDKAKSLDEAISIILNKE